MTTTKDRRQGQDGLFDNEAASALTKVQPLTSIEALEKTWHDLRDKANLVSPVSSVDTIPAMHGISLRAVVIDHNVDKDEVYRDTRFCTDEDDRALGGVALQKIAAAAGIQFVDQRRLDDRSEPYYCEIEVTLGIQDYDGTRRQVKKTRALDLRDGRPEAMKPEKKKGRGDKYPRKTGNMIPLDPSALADRRRHIQSLAETKAFHRALRTILQLKQKYTVDELRKPFVVPKLVPMLDPNDPDQKKALIEMAVGREATLYGHDGGDIRELKDVTPAPAESPPSTSDDVDQNENDPPEEVIDEEDFEPLELPEEEPPPAGTCACPCGCQLELTEKVTAIGVEKLGTPRCRDCYPSRQFNLEKHRDVDNLEIPKMPKATVARMATGLKGGAQ